jgi:hypothetical protein
MRKKKEEKEKTEKKALPKKQVRRINNSPEKIVRSFNEFPRRHVKGVKKDCVKGALSPKSVKPIIPRIDGTFAREQLMSHDASR